MLGEQHGVLNGMTNVREGAAYLLRRRGGVAAPKHGFCEGAAGEDAHERVVEVVGDSARENAERLHLARDNVLFFAPSSVRGLALNGDPVGVPAGLVGHRGQVELHPEFGAVLSVVDQLGARRSPRRDLRSQPASRRRIRPRALQKSRRQSDDLIAPVARHAGESRVDEEDPRRVSIGHLRFRYHDHVARLIERHAKQLSLVGRLPDFGRCAKRHCNAACGVARDETQKCCVRIAPVMNKYFLRAARRLHESRRVGELPSERCIGIDRSSALVHHRSRTEGPTLLHRICPFENLHRILLSPACSMHRHSPPVGAP